jgi:hypothetical protein
MVRLSGQRTERGDRFGQKMDAKKAQQPMYWKAIRHM